jgi:hypothetical protein
LKVKNSIYLKMKRVINLATGLMASTSA